MKKNIPKFVYKYRPAKLEEHVQPGTGSLDRIRGMIEGREIFFGSSFSFNDPFDCRPVTSLNCSAEEFLRICVERTKASRGPDAAALVEAKIRSTLGTTEDLRDPANLARLEAMMAKSISELGVFCAAASPDNSLMWSHYSENFSGVCLEYDTSVFNDLRKVNYLRKRPIVDMLPGGDSLAVQIEKIFYSKSKVWKYEDEWRAIGPRGVNVFTGHAVTRVLFGQNCKAEVREIIAGYVQSSGAPIGFAEVRPDSRSYRLNIVDLQR
ncbi:DUF2971 domain-containing protein [Massilia sp. YIM B02443]|uniref:DUF2971 domain-containing protein n=1 Tax=Massilia sp. YIM B02443 TaxID=3050127 RepID=UPI0025B709DE|nr:DUF2971 domain-containing protein [Massilia sp. YIM B02443]MDN4040268.1 DUF2971 domain-containing protein [Massilia sp. YIM B02443]